MPIVAQNIPLLFILDGENRATPHKNPDCLWVFEGEGRATRKYDGLGILVKDRVVYRRIWYRENDPGHKDIIPFRHDAKTGMREGWTRVTKEDTLVVAALGNTAQIAGYGLLDGTYELIGPGVKGNPEGAWAPHMIRHDNAFTYQDCPRTFKGLREWLNAEDIEGVVFHHPDGRIAKIRKKDFGIKREASR